MICVTHEMGFAQAVANRVIFMDQGQIIEQNEPKEFFNNPQTRANQALPQPDPRPLKRDPGVPPDDLPPSPGARAICPSTNRAAPACPWAGAKSARPGRRAAITSGRASARPPRPAQACSGRPDRPTVHRTVVFSVRAEQPRAKRQFPPPQEEAMSLSTTRRTALAALFLLVAGAAAQADALADIKSAGTLKVGVFADFPPFSSASADMSLKGYDMDVAQAHRRRPRRQARTCRGHRPEPHPLPQGPPGRPPDERRLQRRARQGHRLRRRLRALLHRGDRPAATAVAGPADLAGKTIAVNRGTLEDTSLTEAAPRRRRHQALRQLQRRDPGLHLRPDRADGGRQRRRRPGPRPPDGAQARAEVPAPDLAVAHRRSTRARTA